MRPLHQTPGDAQCLRYAVASIFELSVEDVPFFGMRPGISPVDRRAVDVLYDLHFWLKERGLAFIEVYADEHGKPQRAIWGLCIAFGMTARGTHHAVVWDAGHWLDAGSGGIGRMVHDPHPDGTGLTQIEGWRCLIVRDPARLQQGVREALALEVLPPQGGGAGALVGGEGADGRVGQRLEVERRAAAPVHGAGLAERDAPAGGPAVGARVGEHDAPASLPVLPDEREGAPNVPEGRGC